MLRMTNPCLQIELGDGLNANRTKRTPDEVAEDEVLGDKALSLILPVQLDDPFAVKTEVIGPDRVRLTWENMTEKDGNVPARYRVFCTAPDSAPVEAVTTEKTIEMDTFKQGLTYTCEVHPIYDDLVEGMDAISAIPLTSAPFVMAYEPVAVVVEISSSDAGENESYTTPVPTTSSRPEESIPEVNVSPDVHVETISSKNARVEWSAVKEKDIFASRYRVICKTNDTTRGPIQIASTPRTSVEIDTFEPSLKYTCSVYAIWDELVPGLEVVSLSPGVSDVFTMPNRAARLLIWTMSIMPVMTLLRFQTPFFA
ncbi:hypothetical protein Aperf_G00000002806 [Anoplocephala perfoliata]